MLENEPDTTSPSTEQPASAAAPPRRRRAASRPAGPPSPTATAPVLEHLEALRSSIENAAPSAPAVESTAPESTATAPAPDAPAAETAAEPVAPQTPAKRAPRRSSAKKAAAGTQPDGGPATDAVLPDSAEPAEAAAPAAKKAAPRKRTAKKVAAAPLAAPTTDDSAPTLQPVEATDAVAESPEVQPALTELPVYQPAAGEPDGDEPQPVEPVADEFSIDEPTAEQADETTEAAPLDTAPADATDDAAAALTLDDVVSDEPDADSEPDSDESTEAVAEHDEDDDGHDGRRRRRRRGGRRRRRTGDDDAQADGEADTDQGESVRPPADDAGEGTESPETADETAADDEGDADGDGQRRRRRRRRSRRGEEPGASVDDPTEVVVRVREPRRAAAARSEVTGIEGSTRMEAKRQRRRDGREAGRRRAPILSEAEFLARRESVARKMIVRQRDDPSTGPGDTLSQVAVLEDDILVEHYVDRDSAASLIGNVYLGRVQNVLPSMEAAFIDIGRGRNAVLYAGEVDWDAFGAEGQNRKVERVLKSGQPILVQVSKDPIGAKGARLTNHVSIPGRYIVYAPGGHLSGISRKLPDVERKRLKDILSDLVGESASVIVRTAAEGASEDELVRDVNRLKAQWADIEKKVASGQAPQLLYGEPDLTVRIVRDLFTEDFSELIIAGNGGPNDAYDAVEAYVTHVAPHLQDRLRRWDASESGDLFAQYRLDEQIAKALERKVFLPSGGSLVIDRTEAMTVIDVNTGKFTGSGGNLEATVTSNNLEAAEEIVRQLRLRDIGGIIVIDFIDMVLPANRELLLRRLVECLSRDRTRHQVAEVTSLGLVQMTRKKIGTGLLEAFGTECPHCHGRGVELHELPVDSQKQADGGTREGRPREHRRGNGPTAIPRPSNGATPHPEPSPAAPETETETATESSASPEAPAEEKPARRRSGRSRRPAGPPTPDQTEVSERPGEPVPMS